MAAPFAYADSLADVGTLHTHVAVIRDGIGDRAALFARLGPALRLPDYFGGNWDALDECLRDLSWLGEHRVLLYHEALPGLDDDALKTYLELLRDAVLDWREDEDDELVVAFMPADRERIESLLD